MSDRNPLLFDPARETVTLYPPSIEAQLEDLLDRISEAQASESVSSARRAVDGPDDSEAMRLATKHDELADEYRSKAVEVVLQEIPDVALRRLRGEYPPREGNELDAAWEADRDAFPLALARAMMVEPKMTEAQLDEFFDAAPTRHLSKLTKTALEMTNEDGGLPKRSAVSVLRSLTASD